jgi:AraC family transcriptional regulator
MSHRRDGLRSLLDVLVESVERGGGGEDVAARAHVSRFHFDRIVGAALRETGVRTRVSAHRRHLVLAALDRHGIAVADADPLAWERAHPN